jgi:hypothetical protein
MAKMFPGNPKPKASKSPEVKLPSKSPKAVKGPKSAPIKPMPIKPPTDDLIYRTMPITEKQLGTIKKMYGIK